MRQEDSPLHIAAGKGNVSVAEVLIQNGAEVNARLPYNGYTSLHLASRDGHKKVAELLIAKGAASLLFIFPLRLTIDGDIRRVMEDLVEDGRGFD